MQTAVCVSWKVPFRTSGRAEIAVGRLGFWLRNKRLVRQLIIKFCAVSILRFAHIFIDDSIMTVDKPKTQLFRREINNN